MSYRVCDKTYSLPVSGFPGGGGPERVGQRGWGDVPAAAAALAPRPPLLSPCPLPAGGFGLQPNSGPCWVRIGLGPDPLSNIVFSASFGDSAFNWGVGVGRRP